MQARGGDGEALDVRNDAGSGLWDRVGRVAHP